MVKVQSFPYLRPAHDRIAVLAWQQIKEDGTDDVLPERLPHWDPGTSVTVNATVHMDIKLVWQDCRFADRDRLRLVLLWDSPGTSLRGSGSALTIQQGYPLDTVELRVQVSGEQLADRVRFLLHLVLAGPGQSSFKLAPHIPGSILWQEERVLLLEGQGPRFPMEFLNFAASSNPLPAGAGWYLEWNAEQFDELFMGNVRLFLNKDNKAVFKSTQGHSREDALIQGMIRFDMGKTMIITALSSDHFIDNYRQYEEGSVGATIRNLLNTYFPKETIEGLANLYRNSAARFECVLQERFQLFEEV